jgi:chromosome partitioning protein
MTDFVIACLSQKGGAGKSTLARLIARTYAAGGWNVKIADFNLNQLTSVTWNSMRQANNLEPAIQVEACNSPKSFKRDSADIIIADGKPDSDQSSMEIARAATLCVVPTGTSVDDLYPQAKFAAELITKGVDASRILMVLMKITDNQTAANEARAWLTKQGFRVAETEIPAKHGYQVAQNTGRALSECAYKPHAEKAEALALEIVAALNHIKEAA